VAHGRRREAHGTADAHHWQFAPLDQAPHGAGRDPQLARALGQVQQQGVHTAVGSGPDQAV